MPRVLGPRVVYAATLVVGTFGTQLPSALAPHAAQPLPLWHLALFTATYLVCLLVNVPVSGTVYLNAGLAAIAAVLLIAGALPALLMIVVGQVLLTAYQVAQRLRAGAGRAAISPYLYDLASNIAIKVIATVAAGIALLPFKVTPWDGSRPWPDVLQIVFPMLLLVLVYTSIDALVASLWQNVAGYLTVRKRTIELLEVVGLWKICLVFLGIAAAVLYTTNLFWMLGLMAMVAFLQMIYGQRIALLQATMAASASLRQAVATASMRDEEDPASEKTLVRYSKLAAEQLASDRELLAYKDEVVSLMAHDLRNPLSTMSGYATLLQRRARERPDGESDAANLDRLLAQIKHMATLLDLLVVSSRGAADLFGASMRPMDLGELVTETVAQVRTGVPDRVWRLEIQETVPVSCDPDRITQVLTNLLQNAVKYSPSGSTITVILREQARQAILQIEDEGIGVPARDRDRIFERLQRGSNARKAAPGLGAGLYIVSRIVQAHAGRVWVESEEGKGATFFVALPLYRRDTTKADPVGSTTR
jgi:signal transduction histidine kinase